jgi:hypothetical protein
MRILVPPTLIVITLLAVQGCQSVELVPGKSVELHYDHVANIEGGIRFETAVPLAPPLTSANAVIVKWPNEFWAVFVICSLNVPRVDNSTFSYDRTKFYVEYEGKMYGVLQQPFSVMTDTEKDIGPQDTSAIDHAIVSTIGVGPSTQIFVQGLSPALNYRIAIYISNPDAADKVLTLRYAGHPAILRGRGQTPMTVPGYTLDSPPLPASCRSL